MTSTITLALTGASGAIYGLRLLETLIAAQQTVYFLVSATAHLVIQTEMEFKLPTRPSVMQSLLCERYHATPGQLQVFGREQWTAPIASGSAVSRAMVICPCSSGTLGALANGLSRNLIERAAEVTLKERRRLILVHRETPLSIIHLKNMLHLTEAGALILPASPGFYHNPHTLEDLVDFIVARILDHLDIAHNLLPPWGLGFDE